MTTMHHHYLLSLSGTIMYCLAMVKFHLGSMLIDDAVLESVIHYYLNLLRKYNHQITLL